MKPVISGTVETAATPYVSTEVMLFNAKHKVPLGTFIAKLFWSRWILTRGTTYIGSELRHPLLASWKGEQY